MQFVTHALNICCGAHAMLAQGPCKSWPRRLAAIVAIDRTYPAPYLAFFCGSTPYLSPRWVNLKFLPCIFFYLYLQCLSGDMCCACTGPLDGVATLPCCNSGRRTYPAPDLAFFEVRPSISSGVNLGCAPVLDFVVFFCPIILLM